MDRPLDRGSPPPWWEELIGGNRLADLGERPAVKSLGHAEAEAAIREQRPAGVEGDVMDNRQRCGEVTWTRGSQARPTLAPFLIDGSPGSQQRIFQTDVVPGPLPHAAHRLARVHALPEDERVEEVRAGTFVVRVSLENEVFPVVPKRYVVGARRRRRGDDALSDDRGVGGDDAEERQREALEEVRRWPGQPDCQPVPAVRTPGDVRRLAVSECLLARDVGDYLRPGAFDPSFGDSARSIECRTASAVTGWLDGGEKRYRDGS